MSCRRMSALVLAAGLLMLSFPLVAQPWSPRRIPEPDAVPGELIVLLNQGDGSPSPEEVVESHRRGLRLLVGSGIERPMDVKPALVHHARGRLREEIEANPDSPHARLERYLLLKFPEGADLDAIQAALERDPHVLHVERNYRLRLHVVPSDPLFQVATQPTDYQWGMHLLGLPVAWDYAKGHAYVGLVDTGLQVTHPELRPFHTQNGSQVYDGGPFRAHLSFDYANGDVDVDELGPDALGRTPTFAGHGTHVSGIVAGASNNASGIAGGCWGCSILMAKATDNRSGKTTEAFLTDVANSVIWLVNHGAQVVSMSLGVGGLTCSGAAGGTGMLCTALDLAQRRDVLMTASAGNDKTDIDFPASDSRVMSIGGIESTAAIWDRSDEGEGCPCNYSFRPNWLVSACSRELPTFECGSNFTATPGSAQQDLVAPARQVLSTFYENKIWNEVLGCQDTAFAGIGYDLCTGTSMSSPHVAAVAGILRSANPLLSKTQIESALTANASRAGNWDPKLGYGYPKASASVQAVLGRTNGMVLANRLTPLFSMYSPVGEDYFYTTVPQMGAAAQWNSTVYYYSVGPDVPGYGYFPGSECQVSPCSPEPGASVYIFTTDRSPNGQLLVPLYRMTFEGTFPGGPNNSNNRDTTYTTEPAGILSFKNAGYKLDGIEGYIYKRCTPEPQCIPAGAVRLYRLYNATRDDFAIFPESERDSMLAAGYASSPGLNDWIGYVYPNSDGDFDNVINGFEGLIGTDPSRGDSDCDGLSDGAEILGYPNTDPLVANSGPGCVLPKDARVLSQSVPATMAAGRVYAVSVTLKNAGTETWSPIGPQCGAYRLGSANPYNNGTWVPATRVELPAPVAPGQQVTLNFNVSAPLTPGTYNFQWRMVQECVTWFGDFTPNVAVTVQAAPPRDAQILSQNVPAAMVAGQSYGVSMRLRNVGTQTWSPIGAQCNGYRLGSVNPYDNTTWGSSRVELPAAVAPGGEVTLNFTVTAPATSGTYNFQWRMVQECVTWFGDLSPNVAVPVTVFADVPLNHWARSFIEALYFNGITAGCALNPRRYCPDDPMGRATAAVFLIKAKGPTGYTPPPAACSPPYFQDVPCTNPAAPYIEEFARRGITAGCGGGNYCPDSTVSRGTMAYFLLATLGISPPTSCTGIFSDVPCTAWYAPWVEELYRRGITAGCGGGRYCPDDSVSRSQAAVFVVMTFNLPRP